MLGEARTREGPTRPCLAPSTHRQGTSSEEIREHPLSVYKGPGVVSSALGALGTYNLPHNPMRKYNRHDLLAHCLPWGPGEAVGRDLLLTPSYNIPSEEFS